MTVPSIIPNSKILSNPAIPPAALENGSQHSQHKPATSPDDVRLLFHQAGVTDALGIASPQVVGRALPPVEIGTIASEIQRPFEVAHQGVVFGLTISGKEFIKSLLERCEKVEISFEGFYTNGTVAKKCLTPTYLLGVADSFLQSVNPTSSAAYLAALNTPAVHAWLCYLQAQRTADVDTFLPLRVGELLVIRSLMLELLHEKLPPLSDELRNAAVKLLRRKYPLQPALYSHPEAPDFSKIVVEYLLFAKLSITDDKKLIVALSDATGWRFEITIGKEFSEIYPAIALPSHEILTSSGSYNPVPPVGTNSAQCILNMLTGCELPGPHTKNENFFKALLTHMTKGIAYCPLKRLEHSQAKQAKEAAEMKHRTVKKLMQRGTPYKNVFPYYMVEILRHSLDNHLFRDPYAAIAFSFNALCLLEGVAEPLELEIIAEQLQKRWVHANYPKDHPLALVGQFLAHPQGTIQQRLALIKLCLFITGSHGFAFPRSQQEGHLVEARFGYSLMADVQAVSDNLWMVQEWMKLGMDPLASSLVDALLITFWPVSVTPRTGDVLQTLPQSLSSQVPQEFLLGFLLTLRVNTDLDPIIYLPKLIGCYPHLASSILSQYQSINKKQYDLRPLFELPQLDAIFQILIQGDSEDLLETFFTEEILPNPNLYEGLKKEYAKRLVQQLSPSIALRCLEGALREQLFTMQEEIELLPRFLKAWTRLSSSERHSDLPRLENICNQLQVIDALGIKPDLALQFYEALQIIPADMRGDRMHQLHQRLESAKSRVQAVHVAVTPAPVLPSAKGRTLPLQKSKETKSPSVAPPEVVEKMPPQYVNLLNRKDLGTAGKEMVELLIENKTAPLLEITRQFIDRCVSLNQIGAACNFLNNPSVFGRLKNYYPKEYLDILIPFLSAFSSDPKIASSLIILLNGFDKKIYHDFPSSRLSELIHLLYKMQQAGQIKTALKDLILLKAPFILPCLQRKGMLRANLEFYALTIALNVNSDQRQSHSRTLVHLLSEQELTPEFLAAHKAVLRQVIDDTFQHAQSPAARLLKKIAESTSDLALAEECIVQFKSRFPLRTVDDFKWIIHIVFRFQNQLTPADIARFFHYFSGQIPRPTKKWEQLYNSTLEACQAQELWMVGVDLIHNSPFPSLRQRWEATANLFIEKALRLNISAADLNDIAKLASTCANTPEVWEAISQAAAQRGSPDVYEQIWHFLERFSQPAEVLPVWMRAIENLQSLAPAKVLKVLKGENLPAIAEEHFTKEQVLKTFHAIWNYALNHLIKSHAQEVSVFALHWSTLCISKLSGGELFEFTIAFFQNILSLQTPQLTSAFEGMVQNIEEIQGASVESARKAITALKNKHRSPLAESLTRSLGTLLQKSKIPLEERMKLVPLYEHLGSAFLAEGIGLIEEALESKTRKELFTLFQTVPVGDFLVKATEQNTTPQTEMVRVAKLLLEKSHALVFTPKPLVTLTLRGCERLMGKSTEGVLLFLTHHHHLENVPFENYKKVLIAFDDNLIELQRLGIQFIRQQAAALFSINTKGLRVSPFFSLMRNYLLEGDLSAVIALLPSVAEAAHRNQMLNDTDSNALSNILIETVYRGAPTEPITEFGELVRDKWRKTAVLCEAITRLKTNTLTVPYAVTHSDDVRYLYDIYMLVFNNFLLNKLPHEEMRKLFVSLLPVLAEQNQEDPLHLIRAYISSLCNHTNPEELQSRYLSAIQLILESLRKSSFAKEEIGIFMTKVIKLVLSDVTFVLVERSDIPVSKLNNAQKISVAEKAINQLIAFEPARKQNAWNIMTSVTKYLQQNTGDLKEIQQMYFSYIKYLDRLPVNEVDSVLRSCLILECHQIINGFFFFRKSVPASSDLQKVDEEMCIMALALWTKFEIEDLFDLQVEKIQEVFKLMIGLFSTLRSMGGYYERLGRMLFPSNSLMQAFIR